MWNFLRWVWCPQRSTCYLCIFLVNLDWAKAMMDYAKPQQWKKEESEGLRWREIKASVLILDLYNLAQLNKRVIFMVSI